MTALNKALNVWDNGKFTAVDGVWARFCPVKHRPTLTWFGKEVDERVGLAALVQLQQLRAAVQAEVVDAQASLAADGGVQQGALGEAERGNSAAIRVPFVETPRF